MIVVIVVEMLLIWLLMVDVWIVVVRVCLVVLIKWRFLFCGVLMMKEMVELVI